MGYIILKMKVRKIHFLIMLNATYHIANLKC